MLSTTHFLLAFIPFLVISCTIHYVYKKVRTSGNSSNIYYVNNDLPNDFINEEQEKSKYQKLLDEANRDEKPFYKIDGLDDVKLRYLRLVGRPFRFRKSRLPTYETIPYGMPVSVLQEPSFEGMPNVTFLTLMLSRSCDFKIRSIVRNQTKGKQHDHDYHIVFVLATSPKSCNEQIAEENKKYRDILQFNHVDAYRNITLSVLFSFHYISRQNLPVKYVFKTDSDCVVNYPLLKRYIFEQAKDVQNNMYMGRCDKGSGYNYYLSTRKNFIPRSVILNELFIPYYVTGGGYLISYSILPRLLLGIRHLPFIGHNEDVNVGRGMKMMGIPCVNIKDKWISRYGCDSKEACSEYVVLHPFAYDEEIIRFYSYVQWRVSLTNSATRNHSHSPHSPPGQTSSPPPHW